MTRWAPRGMVLAAALVGLVWASGRALAQVNLSGLSGYWNSPSAQVLGDADAEVGYNTIPKRWTYDHRNEYRNDVYFATVGFIPRVEVSARVTAIPGFYKFQGIDSLTRYSDADRMLSGKLQVVRGRRWIPDLTLGVEDPFGTRRFHTSYVVAGRSFRFGTTHVRADAGYAFILPRNVAGHTLKGGFLGVDARFIDALGLVAEYDSEKWNLGVKLRAPLGLTGRLVWLNAQSLSGGVGLHLKL